MSIRGEQQGFHGTAVATRLFKKLVAKSDINGDGAIRAGDVSRIRNQAGVGPINSGNVNETQVLAWALDSFRRSAASQGGPTIANIKTIVGETKTKLRARDVDGDGEISMGGSWSAAEKALIGFADSCRGLTVSDFKIPAAHEWQPPPFNWSGTAKKVCQSLLDHCSKPSNDNHWPDWASPDGGPRASRYVLTKAEAESMVEELRPLYLSRRRSVLTELANRTQSNEYGCVSPSDAAKRVFEDFAEELGLDLTFDQPSAPQVPGL